ncbi:hypothetical protein ACFWTE_01360 [Nocardiopsis sp. NPDC058631]|uniref:hypothetical protein n=1 Tax=Nocardiopsis sp. NPDC058631 TaxID=3346566 RepID=UPI00365E5281
MAEENHRRPLPLAAADEECALDAQAYRRRITAWRDLLRNARGHRGQDGYVWEVPAGDTRALEALVAAERECCAFLDLRVVDAGRPRTLLHVSLAPGARPAPAGPAEEAARFLGALPRPTG